jgi:hypothetical protein
MASTDFPTETQSRKAGDNAVYQSTTIPTGRRAEWGVFFSQGLLSSPKTRRGSDLQPIPPKTAMLEDRSPTKYLQQKLAVPAEPTYGGFRSWYAALPPLEAEGAKSYWLSTGSQLLKIDKLIYRLLVLGSSKNVGLGELLSALPVALRDRVQQYIVDLEPKGFISFARDGRRLRRPKADARIVYHGTASQRPFLKLQEAPFHLREERANQTEEARELVQISM